LFGTHSLHAQAQIVFDNASSNSAFSNTGIANLTVPHTVGTGVDRILYVGVSTSSTVVPVGAPASRVITVTFRQDAINQNLERVGTQISSDTKNAIELFRLVSPVVGNGVVSINFSVDPLVPNPVVNYAVGGAVSFTGVNQTTPNGAFFSSTANNNTPIVNVTDAVAGDVVLDTLGVSPTAIFAGAGPEQIERYNGRQFFNSFDIGAGSTEPATGSPVPMSWTLTNLDSWALGATAIKAAPPRTAATVTVSGRVLTSSKRGVQVKITNSSGETRSVFTNSFGFYQFEDLSAGEIYIVNVFSKRYIFNSRVVNLYEDISELDFVPVR